VRVNFADRVTPLRDTDSELIRTPPYNGEAEQALLGALLINNAAYARVSEFLLPEHFGSAVHARIFAAVGKLIQRGQDANPVTLKNLFDQDIALSEIGGAQYLARLAGAAVTIINAEDYGRAIHNLYLRRMLIGVIEEGLSAAYGAGDLASTADLVARHQAQMADIVHATTGKIWAEPAELLTAEAVPSFPIAFLPRFLADFALDQATRMQCPLDFIAVPALIVAATLIGRDCRMAPKALDPWAERPCLWGGVIADVGSKKTAGFNAVLAPIWRMQAEFHESHRAEIKSYQAKLSIAKTINKQWERDCASALKNGEEPPERPGGADAGAPPTARQLIANDTTQERLAELMQQNPRGIALFRDELSGWFASFNQYRPGSDEQFYLGCHAGGAWAQDRKIGNIWIDDLYLNIFGGFQPEVIAEVLGRRVRRNANKSADNGLAARFLCWSGPTSPRRSTGSIRGPTLAPRMGPKDCSATYWPLIQNASSAPGPRPRRTTHLSASRRTGKTCFANCTWRTIRR